MVSSDDPFLLPTEAIQGSATHQRSARTRTFTLPSISSRLNSNSNNVSRSRGDSNIRLPQELTPAFQQQSRINSRLPSQPSLSRQSRPFMSMSDLESQDCPIRSGAIGDHHHSFPSLPSLSTSTSFSRQSSDSPLSHHSSPRRALKGDASGHHEGSDASQGFSPRERLPSIAQLDLPFLPSSTVTINRRSSLVSSADPSPKAAATTAVDGLTNNYFPGGIGARRQSGGSLWLSPLRGGQGGQSFVNHPLPTSDRALDLVSPRSASYDVSDVRHQRSPLDSKNKAAEEVRPATVKRTLDYDEQEDQESFQTLWKRRAVEESRSDAANVHHHPSLLASDYPPLPRIRKRSVSDSHVEPQWNPAASNVKPPLSKSVSSANDQWIWQNSRAEDDQRRSLIPTPSSLPAYAGDRSPSTTSTLSLHSAGHLRPEERASSTPGSSFRTLQEDVQRRPNTAGAMPRYSFNSEWYQSGSSTEPQGQGLFNRNARSHSPYPMTSSQSMDSHIKTYGQPQVFAYHHGGETLPAASWSHQEATRQFQEQRRSLPYPTMSERGQPVGPSQGSLFFVHQSHQPRPTSSGSSSQARDAALTKPGFPSSTTEEGDDPASLLQTGSIRGKTIKINPIRRRGKLPKETTELLRNWLLTHAEHPYPTEQEKKELCVKTGLTMNQVCNWMINGRRRILLPAMESAQKEAEEEEEAAARASKTNQRSNQHHQQPTQAQFQHQQQHQHQYQQPVSFRPPVHSNSQSSSSSHQHLPSLNPENASYRPSLTSSFPFSHRF